MRFPDFLIIGAMKAGTTTLYRDLAENPAVFLPIDKEPHALIDDKVLSEEGRGAYARHFGAAHSDQACGEASTGYTKRPDHEGVAGRARAVCGAGLKVIYIVRHPIDRIISQHHHRYTSGNAPYSIDEAVRTMPEFINYSRYAMQLEPWVDAFGLERVLVLTFEAFVADRRGGVEAVSRFLGVTPRPDLVDADRVYNRSEYKPVHRGFWTRVYHSGTYRHNIRPLLPMKWRDALRERLFPKAPPRPAPPLPETIGFILDQVGPEVDRLRSLLGEHEPRWRPEELWKPRDTSFDRRRAGQAESGLSSAYPSAS